ncbi:MAG: TlpA family protein disulfide reductase [Marinilabiliaceae bacterium]|nr:TlpA family protein disulfide reductase [Marinilabiliaceae bacterium]
MMRLKIIIFFLYEFLHFSVFAQENYISFKAENLYGKKLILGLVNGDVFKPLDSFLVTDDTFSFKVKPHYKVGMYRVVVDNYVSVNNTDEPFQQLDFIYNGENVVIETNFNSPIKNTKVIESNENELWFSFIKDEYIYQKNIKEFKLQIDYFQTKINDKYYTDEKKRVIIARYNQLQQNRIAKIEAISNANSSTFAGNLINCYREPFLDGNLNEEERRQIQLTHYFDWIDFSNEQLINTNILTQKVFDYLLLYVKRGLPKNQQEFEFKKGIDVILEKSSVNDNVSAFVVDYLMRGFESLKFYSLQAYIADLYKVPDRCTDDKSTLQRRLAYQKMTKELTAPSFVLKDEKGMLVNLNAISNHYKLILFWATWCPYCKEMIPQLKRWYYSKTIDLEVISIAIDENTDDWNIFLQKNNLPWVNCIEPQKWDGEVATSYNIYATPSMFLLDNDNKIIAKPIDFDEFINVIAGLDTN